MKKFSHSTLPILLTCLSTIVAGGLQGAESSTFVGNWNWNMTTRDGQTRESTLILKKEGDKWSATVKGPRGETPAQDLKIAGHEISFKTERETQQGQMTALYKGKLQGDAIKGTIVIKNGDQTRDREWSATREGTNITGEWAWSMKRDNGESWTAVLHLKKEADKITGYFQREGSENKVEVQAAKLAGTTLSFDTVMQRDGQSTTIKNSAVITGKTMKGKSEGSRDGETFSREWEATKK